MARQRPRKTFHQHLQESFKRDPELAEIYQETHLEGQLALSIARVREERGLTQRDLAAASGIAQPVISRLERGAETPTIATLQKLARALDAKVEIDANGAEFRVVMPALEPPITSVNAVIGGNLDVGGLITAAHASVETMVGQALFHFQHTTSQTTLSQPLQSQARDLQAYTIRDAIWQSENTASLVPRFVQDDWIELAGNASLEIGSAHAAPGVVASARRETAGSVKPKLAPAS